MPTDGNGGAQKVSLGTKVDEEFKSRVRIIAAHKGISMSQYVKEAVEERVEEDLEEGNSISPVTMTAD